MKKNSKFVTAAVVLVMLLLSIMPAFAQVNNVLISIPANKAWSVGYGDTHDARYSTIGAKCESVYPESGLDTFTRIQYAADYLDGSSWVTVTTKPYEVLVEGDPEYKTMQIREGYLNIPTVWFKFRGNTDASARAVVSYNGSYHP